MECQLTTKNLKINKNKRIGTVIIVVEGESTEFDLLKHIFTKVLDYNYFSMKRAKVLKHEFVNENSNNVVIVANTKSSSIKSILDDEEYKEKLYQLLKSEYKKNLKNTNIYILWDRDKESIKESQKIQTYYQKSIDTFYSALDNGYEMNGLLLLSYPCLESYNLSNFSKQLYKQKFKTSMECKHSFNSSRNSVSKIDEKTLLVAVKNMHRSLLKYNIRDYDTGNLKFENNLIYKKESECYKNERYFEALSLISMMLIDLGIISQK